MFDLQLFAQLIKAHCQLVDKFSTSYDIIHETEWVDFDYPTFPDIEEQEELKVVAGREQPLPALTSKYDNIQTIILWKK